MKWWLRGATSQWVNGYNFATEKTTGFTKVLNDGVARSSWASFEWNNTNAPYNDGDG